MLTFYYTVGQKLPGDTCFELIKQAGFDGVTLWWGDDYGDTNFRDNPARARKAGLFVENIHTPISEINHIWLDNHEGDSLFRSFMGIVDDCVTHDIPTMILHLSGGDSPPPFNELGLNRFKQIVEKAEKRGINVAFENLKKVAYLDYVLKNIDSPRAGFCYDSGHHNCFCPDEDLLPKYGNRLMALHLHDNDGTKDQHLLPFEGTIDWATTMGKISETGYAGPIAFEVGCKGYEDLPPEEYLSTVYKLGKRLEALTHSGEHK